MTAPLIVVLAGGRARRMGGGDKTLLPLGRCRVIDHVLARLDGQGDGLALNVNGPPERFGDLNLPLVADLVPGQLGPLAGLLSGMEWAIVHRPALQTILSVPADTPFLPRDLAARLCAARDAACAEAALAASAGRVHGVIGVWPVRLAPALRRALVDDGLRRARDWIARHRVVEVDFAAIPVDPFCNINTPEDLAQAEQWLARYPELGGD